MDVEMNPCYRRPGRLPRAVLLLLTLAGVLFSAPVEASKNLLPRMPELVIERGYSDAFQVVECTGKTQIQKETADSTLKVVLRNISAKAVDSSLKIRILYALSDDAVKVSVNGQGTRFDRRNPRIRFSLEPNQDLTIQIQARHSIEYNLEALKQEEKTTGSLADPSTGKKGFALSELTKFFGHEHFGRRFLVGSLVSKWGIFPLDFKAVTLSVTVPREFGAVLPQESQWQKTNRGQSTTFTFQGQDGFSGAVFLPDGDVADFKKLQSEALEPKPVFGN